MPRSLRLYRSVLILVWAVLAMPAMGMSCLNLQEIMGYYLQNHYSKNKLTGELNERTLNNYINKTKKPVLEYQFPEAFAEAYTEFYSTQILN